MEYEVMGEKEFDVALSFAGENREYVEEVASVLKEYGVEVFYDAFEAVDLWGEDLGEKLHEIYSKQAEFCVIFISGYYKNKIWPTHEKRSILERAINQATPYLLPARFDDTALPGLQSTISYIDLNDYTPTEFAHLIIEKIKGEKSIEKETKNKSDIRLPKEPPPAINPYEEAQAFIDYVRSELSARKDIIDNAGAALSLFDRGDRVCIRILDNGETIYALDIWPGGFTTDTGLRFNSSRGKITTQGGTSATAELIWSEENEEVALKMIDFSLFSMFGGEPVVMTYSEFVTKLWDRIIDTLDKRE